MIKQNRMYGTLLNPLYEGVDLNELCVATYLVGAKKDEEIVIKAQSIGIEQTTGSWVDVPEETDEVRAKYASTYKLRSIVKNKNGVESIENDERKCEVVNIAARDKEFVNEVCKVINYNSDR